MRLNHVANTCLGSEPLDRKEGTQNGHRVALCSLGRLGGLFFLSASALLALFFWLLNPPPSLRAGGAYHYVAPGGVDSARCTVAHPCLTIQQAISNAVEGDEIRVAAGRYTATNLLGGESQAVYLNKSLTLRGGFTTTHWASPDPEQHLTIIDAQRLGRVIYVAGDVEASVSGFHLVNGQWDSSGAGVYNERGTLTLQDCAIYDNHTTVDGGGVANGATNIEATLVLRRSRIYSNTAAFAGAGISIFTGTVSIEGNEIYDNAADQAAGGILIFNGVITVRNTLLYSNTSHNTATLGGGGVYVGGGTVSLENDTVYANRAAYQGGGIYAADGTLAIVNTLVVSNAATVGGGGIYSESISSGLNLAFTDFFGNAPCALEDGHGVLDPTTLGSDNRVADPAFVDPENFDLHLSSGSPALDSGTAAPGVTEDYEGNGRPFGGGIDRGADERTSAGDCYARLNSGQVYTDVQAAVDASTGPADVVKVAGYCAGVEARGGGFQTVYLDKALTLQGGYTVTDWIAPRYGPTVLDAERSGRAIYVTATSPLPLSIENLHVTGGQVNGDGGGIYLDGQVSAVLQNNVIYQNEATGQGGGVYASAGSDILLQHNTLYGNIASSGGGIWAGGPVTLYSSIVASNTGGGFHAGGDASLDYNNFYGNAPYDYDATAAGPHDISAPPDFVDPAGGDFHLALTSPAINAADPASPLAADFEGDRRPQGTRADIGADESLMYVAVELGDAGESPLLVIDPDQIRGQPVTFTHTITNVSYTSALTHSFTLTTSNSDGWPVTLVGISLPVELIIGEGRTFEVVVSVPSTIAAVSNWTAIRATSEVDAAVSDTAVDLIFIPGVALAPSYAEDLDPGQAITFTHTLTNTGSYTDTFDLAFHSALGWTTLLTPTSPAVTLGPGATTAIQVRADVPGTAPAGLADTALITATSRASLVLSPPLSAVVTDTTTANNKAGDRYVSTSGSDVMNNCTDRTVPCQTVNHAVAQVTWGDAVEVAQGEYHEYTFAPDGEGQIVVNKTFALRGGWNPSFTSRNPDPTLTILDADGQGRVIYITGGGDVQPAIDGFTIRNGATAGSGGGVMVEGMAAPLLQNNVLVDNRAGGNGGGFYSLGGHGTISHTTLARNTASNHGGGLYNGSGVLSVHRTTFAGNVAGASGGGLYNGSGTFVLYNTVSYSNTATDGGGFYNASGFFEALNDTLCQNSATASGGGLYNAAGTLSITNTIVASNTAGVLGGGFYDASGGASMDYNDVWANSAPSFPDGNVSPGPHSLAVDPLFVDLATGDLHLTDDSLLVDAGDPATTLSVDIDGDLRPVHQGFDIGADELAGCLARIQRTGTIYGDLQQAVDEALADDQIHVSGTCLGVQARVVGVDTISQTLYLDKDLSLLGGWNSTFSSRDPAAYPTTLDAQGLGRAIYVRGNISPTLQDFTLVDGQAAGLGGGPGGADAGGAVYNEDANPLFIRSVISNSVAQYGGGFYNAGGAPQFTGDVAVSTERNHFAGNTATYGGGFYNAGGRPVLDNVYLWDNSADYGGGIYNADGDMDLAGNNHLYDNAATFDGGGFYNAASSPRVYNSGIYSNTAGGSGGGFYNAAGSPALENAVLFFNRSVDGGGIYNAGGDPTLTVWHNTIYGNVATGDGGGIYSATGSPVIRSTLVVSNSSGIYAAGGLPDLGYNDVWGNPGGDYGGVSAGPHSLAVDPLFQDAAGGDFHLTALSPVIDQGDPASPLTTDFDLDLRPSNQGFDIGADELAGCYARLNGDNTHIYGSVQQAIAASTHITDVIDVAGTCRGVHPIVVGGEVLSQTVHLTGTLTLQGGWGWDGESFQGPRGDYVTTLDAMGLGRVFYIGGNITPTIDGFHIVNGDATGLPGGRGGGVYNEDSRPVLRDNRLYSNTATYGGGFYTAAGDPTLEANRLYDNTASGGSAVYHAGGSARLYNNLIYSNTATGDGGGFYHQSGDAELWHNTFYNNTAAGNGGGIYNAAGSPVIRSTVVVSNSSGIYAAGGLPDLDYNDVWGNAGGDYGGVSAGPHSLAVDPLFQDDDLRLAGTSPLVDAGDPGGSLSVDWEDDLRPTHQNFDIGADEVPGCYARLNGDNAHIYGSVQQAIAASTYSTDVVDVAGTCRGVHSIEVGGEVVSQTVHLTRTLTLQGGWGWDGESFQGPRGDYVTTLDAMGLGRVFYIGGNITPTIDGFHIVNGDATGLPGGRGGGVYNEDSQPVLRENHFYGNTAGQGGGLYNASGDPVLETNFIHDNTSTEGGGIYSAGGAPVLEGNDCYDNEAQDGGGLYNAAGSPLFQGGNLIHNNRATGRGGGLYNSGSPTLYNTLVYSNVATSHGGGFYNATGNAVLWHNTFYGNAAAGGDGGGFYNAAGTSQIHSTLLGVNIAGGSGGGVYESGGSVDLAYVEWWDNVAASHPDTNASCANCLSDDPLLANPGDADFHLTSGSPALDIADPSTTLRVDFEGTPRPTNSGFDIGADEFDSCRVRLHSNGQIYGQIQRAVDDAISGDTIDIAEGECRGVTSQGPGKVQVVHVDRDLDFIGSWNRDFTSRYDYGTEGVRTFVNAEGQGRAVYVEPGVLVELDQIAFINGAAAGLGGGPDVNEDDAGGAVYNAGDMTLIRCRIYNSAAEYGGGLYNASGADIWVTGSVFGSDFFGPNVAAFDGGGAYNDGANLSGRNVWLRANVAQSGNGGGLYSQNGSLALTNFWFYSNQASGYGGGLYSNNSQPQLYHNTVNENQAQIGGGVYNLNGGLVISSSIVADNVATTSHGGIYAGGGATLDYNDVWGNSLPESNVSTGSHSIAADPLLVDGIALGMDSPCINTADPDSEVTVDHEMDARPLGDGYDMGADEYEIEVESSLTPEYDNCPEGLSPGEVVTYTHTLHNTGNYTDTYDLSVASSLGWATLVTPGPVTLRSGDQAAVQIRVAVPVTATGDLVEVTTVRATSQSDPGSTESVTDRTCVQDIYRLELAPDHFDRAYPGQVLTFTHTLTNTGNLTDTYRLTVNELYGVPTLLTPGQVELSPYETATVEIQVQIFDWAAGGLEDKAYVVATSLSDPVVSTAAADTVAISYTTGTRYVAVGGDDAANNCTQVAYGPCATVQQAVRQASTGDAIRVARGVYTDVHAVDVGGTVLTQTVYLNKSVVIAGGYSPDDWETAAPVDRPTLLDPQGRGRAIYVHGPVTPTIGGLTLCHGDAAGLGGGLGGEDAGGGLYNAGGQPTLSALAVHSNSATVGGGMYSRDGQLTLQNNMIYRNTAALDGGGVYVSSGTAALEHNTLYTNTATSGLGGGFYNSGGTVTVSNTIVADNEATNYGGLYSGGSLGADYNDVWANSLSQSNVPTGTHSFSADPLFVDVANDDLHLRRTSPCVDTADPGSALPVDFDGQHRPSGLRRDIGADEYFYLPGAELEPDHTAFVSRGTTITYTHTLTNTGETTDTFAITFASSQGWATLLSGPALTVGAGLTETVEVRVDVPLIGTGGLVDVTVITATSQYSATASDTAIDTTHVEHVQGVELAPDRAGWADPGTVVTYTHTLTNTGDGPDTFVLAHHSQQGWAVDHQTSVALDYEGTTTVVVSVTVPAGVISDTVERTTITATSQTSATVMASVVDTTTVNGVPGVELAPDRSRDVSAGGVVTYTHILTNTGNYTATFVLNHSGSQGWATELSPASVELAAGGRAGVVISITVPAAGGGETDVTTVTATMATQPAVSAVVTDTTNVVQVAGVQLAPDHVGSADPGSEITYTHTLTNTGNGPDVFDLAATSSQGWTVQVSPPSISLGGQQTTTVSIRLTVPPDTGGQVDVTTVHAQSQFDPVVTASAVDTTTVTHLPGVALAPDRTGNADPAQTVTYTHTLTNTGNGPDIFDLVATSGQGWMVQVSPPSIALGVQQTAAVTLSLHVLSGVLSGTVDTTVVTATSRADSGIFATATDTTTVNLAFGVELSPDHSRNVSPGVTITYAHTLSNTGSYTDTFILNHSDSQGWPTALSPQGPVTLGPGEMASVVLSLTVPSDAVTGTVDTTVLTATSQTDGSVFDTATDTTTVLIVLPQVTFSRATYSVGESEGLATLTVTLDIPSVLTATVDYATGDGTATAGEDYVTASGTLTFAAGTTVLTFTLPITDDAVNELEETIVLTLSHPSHATLGSPYSATLTILDDDAPTVDLSSAAYSVGEGDGTAPVTVTLNAASALTVTVDYATADGTATAGEDYVAASGTLTFTPGVTYQVFGIEVISDTVAENDETVTLTLSNPNNGELGSHSPATLTIVDDDTLHPPSVYLPVVFRNYAPPSPNGPDLVVTGLVVDPLPPVAGQPTLITVTVRNAGNEAIVETWFFVDLYVDPDPPPDDLTDLSVYYDYGPWNMSPGETSQVTFRQTFDSGGSHTLYVQVDVYDTVNGSPYYGMVRERDERNNIYGPVTIEVSGTGAVEEKPVLPGTGPRPTPTAGP